MTKDILLERFINDDKTAYSQLYEKYVNDLFNYGTSFGISQDVCMDAIHDVFYRLYIKREELKQVDNVKSYLFRSLKNRLMDFKRRDQNITYTEELQNLPFSIDVTIIEVMVDKEEEEALKSKVKKLLDLLTDRQREAIYLRYMQEMDYAEIAQLLNMTAESARKLVHRGFDNIRQQASPDALLAFFMMIFFTGS